MAHAFPDAATSYCCGSLAATASPLGFSSSPLVDRLLPSFPRPQNQKIRMKVRSYTTAFRLDSNKPFHMTHIYHIAGLSDRPAHQVLSTMWWLESCLIHRHQEVVRTPSWKLRGWKCSFHQRLWWKDPQTMSANTINAKKNQEVADPILIQALLLAARATVLFNYPFAKDLRKAPHHPSTCIQHSSQCPPDTDSASLGE